MAGTPPAEIEIDEGLVTRLLRDQHPDLTDLPLTLAANGWDNVIYRLGEDLAVRLPRRAMGAPLIESEQRWLPVLAPTLPIPIPAPVRIGEPGPGYPWRWSVTPWFAGDTADVDPPGNGEATPLGRFFAALHQPAPEDAPHNPYRGVSLNSHRAAFLERCALLAEGGEPVERTIVEFWEASAREPIDVAPTWLHGDPHPRNILVREGRVIAVIDWGDIAQGDRASDLSCVWMLFGKLPARRSMMEACGDVSDSTWRRARGWAAHYGVMLLEAGLIDDPAMARIARRTFANLLAGP